MVLFGLLAVAVLNVVAGVGVFLSGGQSVIYSVNKKRLVNSNPRCT
jgi:hypothetical protein